MDSRGIIKIDCVQQERTITGALYVIHFDQLHESTKKIIMHEKLEFFFSSKHLESCDGQIKELSYRFVLYISYSQDLTLLDLFFYEVENFLAFQRFSTNGEVSPANKGALSDLDKPAYSSETARTDFIES